MTTHEDGVEGEISRPMAAREDREDGVEGERSGKINNKQTSQLSLVPILLSLCSRKRRRCG